MFFFLRRLCILLKKLLPNQQSMFAILCGALYALGFAPFHYQTCLYIGLLMFFFMLKKQHQVFRTGMYFGIGCGLIGISWVYVSIFEYGHLSKWLSALLTMIFIIFLSFYYACFARLNQFVSSRYSASWFWPLSIAACWCCLEWLKAHIFGGFPWLMLGFSALNTPIQHVLPWFGIYGPAFFVCLGLGYFVEAMFKQGLYAILGVFIFLIPQYLPIHYAEHSNHKQFHIALVQGNVAMHDKWNEDLFWRQFSYYFGEIQQLLKPNQIVILPEAAISVPSSYIHRELKQLNKMATMHQSALLIGIPKPTSVSVDSFYNAMIGLGEAKGDYHKQQLVLFGEIIPKILHPVFKAFNIPVVSTIPGSHQQSAIEVFHHPIASLICYELAYPEILRRQLPEAEMIISLSDDGWFGHSSALYQHLEMARTLAYMAQRPHIFVNNNGLSSIISSSGVIVKQIPAWQSGHTIGDIRTESTIVPWMIWGDQPILWLCLMILTTSLVLHIQQKRKSKMETTRHFIPSELS